MNYLFIDSSYDLILGILDRDLNWIAFEQHVGQKASTLIQSRCYELLIQNHLTTNDLSGVITVNGPGFYTGLRLSQGFSDVFKFFGVKQYSFYSYQIPQWCGYQKGIWFTKAYRGEYFFSHWSDKRFSNELVDEKELNKRFGEDQFFIHSEKSLDKLSSSFITNPILTIDLLKAQSQKIFYEVLKYSEVDLFYFRSPEEEFKVNP